jgi:hypothetical protein
MQGTYAPYSVVIRGLSGYAIFFSIILYVERFPGKKIIKHNVCVSIFSTSLCETFLKQEKSASYNKYILVGLYVKYALFWPGRNET